MLLVYLLVNMLVLQASTLHPEEINMIRDYFAYKDIKFVCYFTCDIQYHNKRLASVLTESGVRISIYKQQQHKSIKQFLVQRLEPVGVLLQANCNHTESILKMASELMLFDSVHSWLVLLTKNAQKHVFDQNMFTSIEHTYFGSLHLSVNTDLVVVSGNNNYEFTDVFSFGTIQGNPLEKRFFGSWSPKKGLNVYLRGFKYYNRWDFHNLTFRAISVVLGVPKGFSPSILREPRYTAGVSAMTKVTAQLLHIFREMHNFRFNYTIADRWIGSPKRNSTLAVTNAMYWRQEDISVTCLRIFPQWLEWMDPFFPEATTLETKFYYLISERGVGEFEDRFLKPLSPSVWWSCAGAGVACGLLLAAAATFESRPTPAYYAVFSVMAAVCQQAYEDGVHLAEDAISSQGRRVILLVLGLTSLLLYNYYTSSVVSWLLNAAAPTIATMDGLIASDLELAFEDIGYTRSWLDGPGFYYYSGFKWEKEDELRDKKVKNTKRSVAILQPTEKGIDLVRNGRYAYHTEPYTASQVIGPKFDDAELCKLGSLQMMPRSPVYIVGQKNSPYRQFFVWSLMRAKERGHIAASRRRIEGEGGIPPCSGKTPRALALGQAAPAFAVLAYAMLGSLLLLLGEIMWSRYQKKTERGKINTWIW